MSNVKDFQSTQRPTWCPGCGDFGILNSLKRTFVELDLGPHEVMIVTGIGCGSKLNDYMTANGFHTIHGRPVPVATGMELVNPELKVLVVNGDGDAYGIGGNHFLHGTRRNLDLTHIVENNQIYALTKGQYSPSSDQGFQTTTSPEGAIEQPINGTDLSFTAGATFVARTFAGHPKHMVKIFKAGMEHPGYAHIDCLQPCVTFNHVNTYEYYEERIYEVEEVDGYHPSDREQAKKRCSEWGERIPVGILYQDESLPTYESQVPGLKKGAVVNRELDDLSTETFESLKREFI